MNENFYKFEVRGTNEYMKGVINGMMHCICRDDPAEDFGYKQATIIKIDEDNTTHAVATIMAVDTTQERFDRFCECVRRKYSKVKDFELKVLK